MYIYRKPGYYFFKVLIPLWQLNVIAFMVFLFPLDEIAARVTLIVTTFVASFALQFISNDILPKLDYLTTDGEHSA